MAPKSANYAIRQQLPLLKDLPITENIYLGEDAEHRLQFREHLAVLGEKSKVLLTDENLVALALTEICCRLGRGKVNISVHHHERFPS